VSLGVFSVYVFVYFQLWPLNFTSFNSYMLIVDIFWHAWVKTTVCVEVFRMLLKLLLCIECVKLLFKKLSTVLIPTKPNYPVL
jgi:hypothetical protein